MANSEAALCCVQMVWWLCVLFELVYVTAAAGADQSVLSVAIVHDRELMQDVYV